MSVKLHLMWSTTMLSKTNYVTGVPRSLQKIFCKTSIHPIKTVDPAALKLDPNSQDSLLKNEKTLANRSAIKFKFQGAGPNGLWAALQLKAKNPHAQIEIFEKRTNYARNHTVNINDNCFLSLDSFHNPVITEGLSILREQIKASHGNISCNIFEATLKNIAQEAGIEIHTGDQYEVVAISDDKIWVKGSKNSPVPIEYDVLVCADGSHSKARKALMKMSENTDNQEATINFSHLSDIDEDSEFSQNKKLQYRARVKYIVHGETRRLLSSWLDFFRSVYASFKVMLSPVSEVIGELDDNNQREVMIDFFISKTEYNSLKGYSLKKAADFNTKTMAPSLKRKIQNWQAIKRKCCNETRIVGSETITPYYLSFFHAKKVYHMTSKGKFFCIIGDSATSLPLYRSLNNYLVISAELGKKLACATLHTLPEIGRSYEQLSARRARFEIWKARIKNCLLNILKAFLNVSNKVPWQTNRWTNKNLKTMRRGQPNGLSTTE